MTDRLTIIQLEGVSTKKALLHILIFFLHNMTREEHQRNSISPVDGTNRGLKILVERHDWCGCMVDYNIPYHRITPKKGGLTDKGCSPGSFQVHQEVGKVSVFHMTILKNNVSRKLQFKTFLWRYVYI